MGLKQKVVRAFFLRWLRGTVNDWRVKEGRMKKVLAALDGWKLVIGVVAAVAVRVYDQTTGSSTTSFVDAILNTFGYTPTGVDVPAAATAVWILIATAHKVVKAQQGTLKPESK